MKFNIGDDWYGADAFDTFGPCPPKWYWEPYLPSDSLVLLDGDPGVGKTFVAMDIAARLSRGDNWPDGQPNDRLRSTGLFGNRNDDQFLRFRAEAALADPARIITFGRIGYKLPAVPADVDGLHTLFFKTGIGLLVVDPLPLLLAASTESYVPGVWKALDPLMYAATIAHAVVLLVRHRTKRGQGHPLARGLGGYSLAGAARSALLVARHPDDPDLRLLVHTKSNFGPTGPTLGFRIVDNAVQWEGPVDLSAEELGEEPEAVRQKRPRERAAEWLKQELANGPRKAAELIEAAKQRGIPERTLARAKKMIRTKVEYQWKGELREWFWQDPEVRNEPTLYFPAIDCVDPGPHATPPASTSEGTTVEGVESCGVQK